MFTVPPLFFWVGPISDTGIGSVALAGVGDFEAEGEEVGRVFEDVAEAMVRPGGHDCLPLGGPVPGRADSFGEHGLARSFHDVTHQI